MDRLRSVIKNPIFTEVESEHISSVVQFVENLSKLIYEESFFSLFECNKIIFELNLLPSTRPINQRYNDIVEDVTIKNLEGNIVNNKLAIKELLSASTPLNSITHEHMPCSLDFPNKKVIVLDGSDWKMTIKDELFSDSLKSKIGTALLDLELSNTHLSNKSKFKI